MKTLLPSKTFLFLIALVPAQIFAQAVQFDLQVDRLQTATLGDAMPTSGLVLLVADTTRNGFGSLTVSSIGSGAGNVFSSGLALNGAGGDDLILWRSDLSGGFETAGLLATTLTLDRGTYGGLTWDGATDGEGDGTGDPLALFWFPNLTISSTSTVADTPYGFVTGASMLAGKPWLTPGDVNGYPLYVFTENAVSTGTGTSANSLLVASHTVSAIPEPATNAALAALAVLGFSIHRRRRLRRARGAAQA